MIITVSDFDDGDLVVETTEEGLQVEGITRTYEGNGYTTVTIALKDLYYEEEDSEEVLDQAFDNGYDEGLLDGQIIARREIEREQNQQAADHSPASIFGDDARVYGLGSQGPLPYFDDRGNRRTNS